MLPMSMYCVVLHATSSRFQVMPLCTFSQARPVALPLILQDYSRHFGMQSAAMPHSSSLADLPLDVVQLILAAAVDGLLTDELVIGASCRHQLEGRRKLQFYLHLRAVCRRYGLCICTPCRGTAI